MELVKPATESSTKSTSVYVSVPRTTDAGFTVDLIDTYRRLAVDEATTKGDEKLAEKIAGGSFGGGLKFNYGHALYIIDLDERVKGLQLLTLSHSQFMDLDERRFKLWQKKLAKSPSFPCPISSVYNAYAVEIDKRKKGSKTEYSIDIDAVSGSVELTNEELTKLIDAPRIPEIIYRYSRYQYEATLVFLKQCDTKFEMSIMESPDMVDAIEKLVTELPKEDTSSFSFDKRTKDARQNAEDNGGLSIDDLFNRYDELVEAGKTDKTEEGQELRGVIRTFITQEKLDVRLTRSTSNKDLLDMVEEAYANPKPEPKAPEEPEEDVDTETGEVTSRNRRR